MEVLWSIEYFGRNYRSTFEYLYIKVKQIIKQEDIVGA
jgi:hypothetical protein